MMYTRIEYILVHISLLMLFLVTLLDLIDLFYQKDKLYQFNRNNMKIVFLCTTGFLIIRCFQAGHLPLGNLYESMIFLSWIFSLLYLMSYVRNQNRLTRTVLGPSATFINAFATLSLPDQMQYSTSLVPALQSHWLMMHVSAMLISYATSLCGSLLAIVLLSLFFSELGSYPIKTLGSNWKENIYIFYDTNYQVLNKKIDVKGYFYLLIATVQKCQIINYLDRWTYQLISLGFSFLTIGILSGSVWANEAWGSFWSWDPKETWALVTWLIYAIYLHIKIDERWNGEIPAAAASTGFSLIWICFLGVNLLGIGLHNYGWLT
uniref:Cytochrome c biogenesis protein CcsA n=1 Tax=Antrophyum semicostatum TaxID=1604141 RepID=A0A3G5CUC5_9MONI|nr:cytochrome c heme attachment protein [Antrophyum semicostatum]AYW16296.1 cytochrome c heme attachment protein [Antrophyum semicostatum]